jgi:signal transduction histidine kinase/DNA-binding NarL/FixJ family response regulator
MSINVEEVLIQLRQQPAKIMLVDDEHIVTSSIESYLMLETPHEIFSFNNPREAINMLDTIRPDLVVSDFNMPELTGIEFLKQVKAKFPNTESILLTGYADKENAIAAINEVGIYRYLEKPWDNEQLQSTIEQALERQRLVRGLENTLAKVNKLNQTLKQYNIVLEKTVDERTKELKTAKDKLEAIIHNSADGIVVVTPSGHIDLYNPMLKSWLDAAMPDAVVVEGAPLQQWLPQFSLDALGVDAENGGYQQLKLTRSQMPLEAVGVELPNDNGKSLWVFRNITHLHKIEDMRQDFVATLTHDLRTPLQSAIQFYDFFKQGRFGAITAQQNDMLRVMKESHVDLLNLVNTLLDVYRYESGKRPLVMQELDISHALDQVVDTLKPLAEEHQHTLELAPCDWNDDRFIQGDPIEFKRVLNNLVGNAIKHTPANTQVKVAARMEKTRAKPWTGYYEEDIVAPQNWLGWMHISIEDNGQGISDRDQAHLFQRFSPGTSRKRNSGTGLGLYLAQQIMQNHGGSITLESIEGEGSAFSLWLPVFARVPAEAGV